MVVAALSAACASKSPQTDTPPVAVRPLDRLAGQEIVVFPVQYLSSTDTLGQPSSALTVLYPTASRGLLTVDTQGPKVTSARFDPR